ncbi:hypothetical protein E4T43_03046 [Aureobasidium subglaciale]|nr:hypothetical protein E4T43_03046 [Aureobasidium subglaciale]
MARIRNITLDPAAAPKRPALDTVKVAKTEQLPAPKPVAEDYQSEEDDIMAISDAKMKTVKPKKATEPKKAAEPKKNAEPKKIVEPKKATEHKDATTLKKPASPVQPPESVRNSTVQKKPAANSVKSAQALKVPRNEAQKKPAVESATVSKPPISEMDAAEINRRVDLDDLVIWNLNNVKDKRHNMKRVWAEKDAALHDHGWEIKGGKTVSTISVADVRSKALLSEFDTDDPTDCVSRIRLRLRGLALVARSDTYAGIEFPSDALYHLRPHAVEHLTVFDPEFTTCIAPHSDSDDEGAELDSAEEDDPKDAMSYEIMDETENVQTSIELDEDKGEVSDEDDIDVDEVVQTSIELDEDESEVSGEDDN